MLRMTLRRGSRFAPSIYGGAKESVLQPGFSSGHDFSRAASRAESVRLQPLRDELSSSHTDSKAPPFHRCPQALKRTRRTALCRSQSSDPLRCKYEYRNSFGDQARR
jgi:hypothetical protein